MLSPTAKTLEKKRSLLFKNIDIDCTPHSTAPRAILYRLAPCAVPLSRSPALCFVQPRFAARRFALSSLSPPGAACHLSLPSALRCPEPHFLPPGAVRHLSPLITLRRAPSLATWRRARSPPPGAWHCPSPPGAWCCPPPPGALSCPPLPAGAFSLALSPAVWRLALSSLNMAPCAAPLICRAPRAFPKAAVVAASNIEACSCNRHVKRQIITAHRRQALCKNKKTSKF
eukprot:6211752-Pleurochrysis_carterae.AAC.1